MPARTGEQFLKGLRGPARSGSTASASRTSSTIPSSRGAAHALAEVFDLHHQHPDILLMPDDGDRRAHPGQPHDPALARGPFAPRQGVAPRRRVFGRPDGPHARLHERHLCGLRRQSRRVGQPRQRGRRRAPGRLPEVPAPRRHLAHPHHRAADRRQDDGRRAAGRQSVCPAQGRRHRARHRRARRAHPGDPGAVRRRDRGLSRAAAARRRRRLCAVVLHPHERARAEVPVPRQRLGVAQPLRPSAVEPLRRAGRLRDLRRRRDPARPAVHRLQPRRLQLGDDHELAAQHPAADDDPRLGEARLRLGPGAARGGRDQRHRSRDHAHDRRDLELRRVHALGRHRRRDRGARMAGRHVDARHRLRCTPCAGPCRCGSRG